MIRIVSIAAGDDHLLALTSRGRTYAHPITNKANAYGQLGFRKFDVLDMSSTVPNTPLELIPKSVADPCAKLSPFARASLSKSTLFGSNVNDSTIRFCTNLFEIPALRDVKAVQIAAGGRSSFIRTQSGKVLGWGANEYGLALPSSLRSFVIY
jgi:alpha-tubulin suppressor-like RCC1 family protein